MLLTPGTVSAVLMAIGRMDDCSSDFANPVLCQQSPLSPENPNRSIITILASITGKRRALALRQACHFSLSTSSANRAIYRSKPWKIGNPSSETVHDKKHIIASSFKRSIGFFRELIHFPSFDHLRQSRNCNDIWLWSIKAVSKQTLKI